MTKDQKADTGGDPWESRRPLIHHWAPGQGHSMCELLWKTLPAWSLWQGGRLGAEPVASLCGCMEQFRVLPEHSVCAQQVRLPVLLEMACGRECRQEIRADMSGLVCSGWELLILLPRCLPGSRLHGPHSPSSLEQEKPLLGPFWHCAIPQPLPPAAVPPGKLGFLEWR